MLCIVKEMMGDENETVEGRSCGKGGGNGCRMMREA